MGDDMLLEYQLKTDKKHSWIRSDVNLTEEEIFWVLTAARDGTSCDDIVCANSIKQKLVDQHNNEMMQMKRKRKKLVPDDIIFRMEEFRASGVKGVRDIRAFMKHSDSMLIHRNDGSTITVTVEYGIVELIDSRNETFPRYIRADRFLDFYLS